MAARIPAASKRMLSEMHLRLTQGGAMVDRAKQAEAAQLLPEVEDLLHRGIACGALADPWNVLGFQGMFPLSQGQGDAVRAPRIDDLVQVVGGQLDLYARVLSESAAAGDSGRV